MPVMRAAVLAVALLAPVLVSAVETTTWRSSKHYYWNGCKLPCTSNSPNYKPYYPKPPTPDPAKPERLICQAGYGYVASLTGFTTPMCVPCESGFYSPGGRSRCLSCAGALSSGTATGAGFVTPQGASSASQCVCAAGFGGPGCKICAPGTFSTGGRLGSNQNPQPACLVCPDGSKGSQKAGAISRLECGGCNPGFGGLGCKACPAGKYSTGGDYSACKSCGAFQSSRPQSPGPEYCVCAAGYGSADGAACTLCPIGTFWPGAPLEAISVGEGVAQAAAGKLGKKATLSACLPCSDANGDGSFTTVQQGARTADQCVCSAGYGSKLCSMCPKGTWSPGGSTADCIQCGGLGTTEEEGSTSAGACGCQAGYGGVNCERCPANSFSIGGAQSECQPCAINTEAPAGSSASTACVPKAGYGSNAEGVVVPCPVNTWSAGGVLQACEPCPAGTVSPSTSKNVDACVCLPGYKPGAAGCIECQAGEVCPGGSSSGALVIECPAGATSPAGSDSTADCVCKPGYGGAACDLCPESYYSPGGSKAGCLSCGLGKTSPAGSISADACVCLPGRGGPTCALCPAGTYSAGLTTDVCAACPDGATTVSTGNKDPSDCVCKPGFAGPFCTACKAGEMCPGGTRLAPVVCPANSYAPDGATTVQQCVCKAGFGRPASSPLGCTTCPICEACPAGTYSEGGSTDSCKPCGRTLTTPTVGADSKDACVCSPGYGGATCAQCPANTYSTGFSTDDCTACPANSKSPAGSTSSAACVCAAGYGGPSCSACPAGTFSAGGTSAAPNAACTRCGVSGSGYTTQPTSAATSDVACVCKPGFGGAACASCPANTWGAGGSTDSCLACPAGTVSQPNSDAAADCKKSVCPAGQELSSGAGDTQVTCVCQAGYGSGSATTPCTICASGTYSAGGAYDACKPCGFGLTGPEGATSKDQCVESAVKCPVGMSAGPGAVSAAECACLPGYGATGSGTCAICPPGAYSLGLTATASCVPCAFGETSPVGSSSPGACYTVNACPAGTYLPVNTTASTVAECVCRPGFGAGLVGPGCFQCPVGSYSPGDNKEACIACPFGTTSAVGSTSVAACVAVQTACPVGMSAPAGAASAAECACMAGFGTVGGSKESCALCSVGTFSAGGTLDPCTPCGFGFTSPAGAKDESFCYPSDQCPPGTVLPLGASSSAAECVCKAGFGGNALATLCTLCPAGSYSANSGREACLPCPFGTASGAGATKVEDCKAVAQECPVGMSAPADAVSAAECGCLPGYGIADAANPSKGCAVCPAGTYSPGGTLEACFPCGFGLTSPVNSDDATDCYPYDLACPPGMEIPGGAAGSTQAECACKAGYGAPAITADCKSGDLACKCPQCTLCPAGTYAAGGTREQCLPCPFGTTSAPGAKSADACVVSETTCPPGQIADAGALECHCMAGFGWTGTVGQTGTAGSCQICPVGWWSYGIGLQPCMPCGFGMTSPIGSDDPLECYPVDQCPVGMYVDPDSTSNPPSSAAECICKPGYGGTTDGTACFKCPYATWNNGKNGREPCQSCGFGFTSPEGATDGAQCERYLGECPNGQGPNGAPSDPTETPVSPATCSCLPGYGNGGIDQACTLCAPGSYSRGGTWQPCTLCPAGTTSLPGATDVAECLTDANLCPAGMQPAIGATTQASQCVCKAGFGGVYSGADFVACFQCAPGTFSAGGTRDPCASCPLGFGSPYGATAITQCTQCPTGFFGTNGICTSCPIGTTTVPGFPANSAADCNTCAPGFGFATNACAICPAGTYSSGGKVACTQCPLGMSSAPGATSTAGCFCSEAGYGTVGNDTTTCVLCPVGFYSSPVRGVNACVACPVGMTTVATGKTGPAQCVCAAGYGSRPGSPNICEPCLSPFYQGELTSGVPTTTATEVNPYPECLLCTGAQVNIVNGSTNTITQVTGDVNKLCNFNTTRPSAYCTDFIGVTPPPCGTCLRTWSVNSSGPITLPNGLLSLTLDVVGAAGSSGNSIFAVGTQNVSGAVAGGLGGRIQVAVLDPSALSGATIYTAVGQTGASPAASALVYGGGGGGYSAVWTGNADPTSLTNARWLASAGGGGGGGTSTNGITGTAGGAGCTAAVVVSTFATQISSASAGSGGQSVDPAANGFSGRGPAGNTGNGGSGSANNNATALGSAGGGGGGGYGTGSGAGGIGTNSNSVFNGLAGGAPGGGGGGGAGAGPLAAGLNYGLTPGGGGGGGYQGPPGTTSFGGANTVATPGSGGLGGVCQRDSATTIIGAASQAPSRGAGSINIRATTNELCPL